MEPLSIHQMDDRQECESGGAYELHVGLLYADAMSCLFPLADSLPLYLTPRTQGTVIKCSWSHLSCFRPLHVAL